jgi:hypothetical protein
MFPLNAVERIEFVLYIMPDLWRIYETFRIVHRYACGADVMKWSEIVFVAKLLTGQL